MDMAVSYRVTYTMCIIQHRASIISLLYNEQAVCDIYMYIIQHRASIISLLYNEQAVCVMSVCGV